MVLFCFLYLQALENLGKINIWIELVACLSNYVVKYAIIANKRSMVVSSNSDLSLYIHFLYILLPIHPSTLPFHINLAV